mgnify:CR=1 FL=1
MSRPNWLDGTAGGYDLDADRRPRKKTSGHPWDFKVVMTPPEPVEERLNKADPGRRTREMRRRQAEIEALKAQSRGSSRGG